MPVVPFTGPQPQTLPMPDEQFALMAAAQMHGEGRLIQPVADHSERWNKENWSDTWKMYAPPENRHLIPKDWETIDEDPGVWGRPKPAPEDLIS